jgi:hypothetical protein
MDLCALVGHPTPVEADPTGQDFAFERGVGKLAGGDTTKVGDAVGLSIEEFDLAATATRKIIGAVFVPAGSRLFGRTV